MSKPEPKPVPSDDCTVTLDGVDYFPHEGETVWLLPGQAVGEIASLARLMALADELAAIVGDDDEARQAARLSDEAMRDLCEALAPRILDWDWTDLAGRPLPKPDGTARPLLRLQTAELYWLLSAARGETPSARKNDSRPSPTTSSASEPRPSQRSSGAGRSR